MQEKQEKIIIDRLEKVYCRLAPSNIHGVGIFAIKNIPKGINPFDCSYMAQKAITINKDKIKNPEILTLLHDYHPTADITKQIVSDFPNQLIWSNYVNYTDNPNIELLENGEWSTLRDIEKGEELLENPKRLLNEDGSQKMFKISISKYPMLFYF